MNELSFPLLPGEKKKRKKKIACDDVICGGKSFSCSRFGSGKRELWGHILVTAAEFRCPDMDFM